MIQGTNVGESVFKLFLTASSTYADKLEELAAVVMRDEPVLGQLLNVLASSTAQSVNLIVRFWPNDYEKNVADGSQRSA